MTPARQTVRCRSNRGQAGVLRYPSTCLLRATPLHVLLYRPQPWQICKIGKVPAYGSLPSGPARPPLCDHADPPHHLSGTGHKPTIRQQNYPEDGRYSTVTGR
jgi:hypothetical protein